jgi:mRNA interferase RelE/StbE
VSYEVIYEVQFLDLAAGFMRDDAQGVGALFADIDQLAGEPRPETSFPYGSPDRRRLRAGRYRVMYLIDDDALTIKVGHLGRA